VTRNSPFGYSPDGSFEVSYRTCPDCGEQYVTDEDHRRQSERHQAWVKGTAQPEIPVPRQPDAVMFTTMPTKVVMGDVAVCPRCKGKRPLARKDFAGRVTKPAGTFTTERGKANTPCIRCNGFGIVPNQSV
jgi:uncharacterized C2H2 Zn-finger protein